MPALKILLAPHDPYEEDLKLATKLRLDDEEGILVAGGVDADNRALK